MSTPPVKSQPLHSFSLPPLLKWGGRKVLVYANNHRGRRLPATADHSEFDTDRKGSDSETGSIKVGSRCDSMRFKESRKQTDVLEGEGNKESDKGGERKVDGDENQETVKRPWNLRSRKRLGCSSSRNCVDKNGELQEMVSEMPAVNAVQQCMNRNQSPLKSLRLRGVTESMGVKKEKSKLWIALSREEIEEDIFVITGSRPTRRPRKRPKNVEQQIDNIFPGLLLVGLTMDTYQVA